MEEKIYSVIVGTGSFIPNRVYRNEDFLENTFFDTDGSILNKDNKDVIDRFQEITTIAERRYIDEDLVTSDISYFAAEEALQSSGIEREELDYIIMAHNFGDVRVGNNRTDIVPSLASRVKYRLGIKNPDCVAYDITFGCPGWLQGLIQADYFIRSGDAKKIMVIGGEALSRVSDPHDRDSLIYSDGAAVVIVEGQKSKAPIGILGHVTRSDTLVYSKMLHMGTSYNPEDKDNLYLKMNGRKLYQYALETVPMAVKTCLDKCGIHISQVKKVLIHQANGKMDDAILKRLYSLYEISEIPKTVMPMTISWLGNSSVATIPTLLDLIQKSQFENHKIERDDIIVFASVGAGMNINAVVYKVV